MSGLSYFDALGVRGVDRKPLIIAELRGKPSPNLGRPRSIDGNSLEITPEVEIIKPPS